MMVCVRTRRREDPTEAIYNIILEYLSRHQLDEVGCLSLSLSLSICLSVCLSVCTPHI